MMRGARNNNSILDNRCVPWNLLLYLDSNLWTIDVCHGICCCILTAISAKKNWGLKFFVPQGGGGIPSQICLGQAYPLTAAGG